MTCRRLSRFSSLLLAAWLAATPAVAQPLIFERSPIRIDPSAPTKENAAMVARSPSSYDAEIRSEDALKLEYIHTLNTLTDQTAVVIGFMAPSIVALPRMQVFTPVDALFVAEDGVIVQIYPNAVLAELAQDVYAKEPIKAFVFLKAGEVEAKNIMPQDVITGPMFYPSPPVMQ